MLAVKALGHRAKNSTLSERAACYCLSSNESQDQDQHGYETEEEDKEKADYSEHVIVSAKLRTRILDWRSGQYGGSGNNSKAAQHQLEKLQITIVRWNRAADCILLRTNTNADRM